MTTTTAAPLSAEQLDKLPTYDPDRDTPGMMELRDKYNDGDYFKAEDVRAIFAQARAAGQAEPEKCEDCDGRGHDGDYQWQGHFQPPEPGICNSCDGTGRATPQATAPQPVGEQALPEVVLPEAAMFDLLQRYASAVGTHSAVETLRMASFRVDRGEFASEAEKRIEACALREQVRDAIKSLYAATNTATPSSAAPSYWNSQRKMIERAIIGLRDGWATRKEADDALAILGAAPTVHKDTEGNYTTGDEQLDLLLGLTEDMATGKASPDTGLWWLGTLEKVKARIAIPSSAAPAAQAEPLGYVEDYDLDCFKRAGGPGDYLRLYARPSARATAPVYLAPAAAAAPAAQAVEVREAILTGAHAEFSEALPPGSLTSLGHRHVFNALRAAIKFYAGHAAPAASVAQAEDAKDAAAWREGVLMAASVLTSVHDMPTMAGDVLNELGLKGVDCSSLDEFDKENLRKILESRPYLELKGLDALSSTQHSAKAGGSK